MIAQRSLAVVWLVLAGVFAASTAHAQSDEDLARARTLFTDALKDQTAQNYAAALDKLQQVARVKETAQVAYREGLCFEALGQKRAAARAFDRAISLGQSTPSADADEVVRDARAHRAALGQELGALEIGLPPIMGIELRVDEEPISTTLPMTSAIVDPGVHHVRASAAGMRPFLTEVTVDKGATAHVDVVLEADKPPPPPPPPIVIVPPVVQPPPFPVASVVLLSTGALLAGASLVSLGLRAGDIHDLEQSCPNNVCPTSRRTELTSERDQALVLGPLAAVFAASALVATAVAIVVWPRGGPRVKSAATGWTLGGSF